MDRFDHGLVGVASGLAVAAAGHWSVPQALAGAVCAWATSRGRFSPDADQYGSWELWSVPWRVFAWLVSLAPWWLGERGQHGDPCQHRGITHWWGVPVLWALLVAPLEVTWPGAPWWLAWCAIAGWCSHLVGDWLFGRQVWGQHGHGIPLAPWWGHAGLPLRVGLRSDGWAAHAFAVGGAVPASVWLAAVIAHL